LLRLGDLGSAQALSESRQSPAAKRILMHVWLYTIQIVAFGEASFSR